MMTAFSFREVRGSPTYADQKTVDYFNDHPLVATRGSTVGRAALEQLAV